MPTIEQTLVHLNAARFAVDELVADAEPMPAGPLAGQVLGVLEVMFWSGSVLVGDEAGRVGMWAPTSLAVRLRPRAGDRYLVDSGVVHATKTLPVHDLVSDRRLPRLERLQLRRV